MKKYFILLLFIAFVFETQAVIRYVTPTGTGTGTTSWANASNDLQLMINQSAVGDTIWVAAGTYLPIRPVDNLGTISYNNRDNAFVLKKDVHIFGGFSGNEINLSQRNWNTNITILSGDIGVPNNNTDNCHCVVISAGEVGTARLDGFKITKGYNDGRWGTTVNGVFVSNGGGISIARSSLLLINLLIDSNWSETYGGGILIRGDNISSPILTNIIITQNYALNGGGIACFEAFPVLTNVLVVKNRAAVGGGIGMWFSSPVLTNVTISGNTATSTGAGFFSMSASNLIRNSIIWGNIGISNVENEDNISHTYSNCLVSGLPIGNGIILNSDPLFIDTANGNYRLSKFSPAMDVGSNAYYSPDSIPNLSAINVDLDGNPRISNKKVDLGAYEYLSVSVSITSADTVICYGDTAKISFVFGGIPPWQLVYTKNNGVSYDTIKPITDSLFDWKVIYSDTTTYKFVAVGDSNFIVTIDDSIRINVLPYPTVTNIPPNDTLCSGEKTKTVIFLGTANRYEWTTTGNILGLPADSTGNFNDYLVENKGNTSLTTRITVTPKYTENGKTCVGKDTSFSITVYPEVTQTTVLQNDTFCDGETTKAINFEGNATIYQWTATGTVSGLPIGVQTGNFGEYLVTNETANRTESVIKVISRYLESGKECVGIPQEFAIIVRPATIIHSFTPNSTFLCDDGSLIIEVDASGENLVYQWYKDGNLLFGEHNKDFIVFPVSQAQSGVYYVEVTGACGRETSQTVKIEAGGGNMLVEKWQDVIFVDNSLRQYVGYQWYRDGKILNGATEQFYQEIGGLSGCYSVELRLAAGGRMRSCEHCAYKTTKSFSIYPNPTSGQLRVSGDILDGKDREIIIFDVVGQVVFTSHVSELSPETTINLSHLSNGLYFLKVNGKMVKIVKE